VSASFSPTPEDLRWLAEFLEGLQQVTDRTGCYVGEHMGFAVTMPNGDSVQVRAVAPANDEVIGGRPVMYSIDDRIGD
jgi:hypothetical protein